MVVFAGASKTMVTDRYRATTCEPKLRRPQRSETFHPFLARVSTVVVNRMLGWVEWHRGTRVSVGENFFWQFGDTFSEIHGSTKEWCPSYAVMMCFSS